MLAWLTGQDRFHPDRFVIDENSDPQPFAVPVTPQAPPSLAGGAQAEVRGWATLTGFLSAMVKYIAIVVVTVAGTIFTQTWIARYPQNPWLRSFLEPYCHPFVGHPSFPVVGLQQTPPAFNYALRQCGAEAITELTGVTPDTSLVARLASWVPETVFPLLIHTSPDYALDGEYAQPHCWEFHGHRGQLGFALIATINVSWVSIGHYDHEPGQYAPRSMVLWGQVDVPDVDAVIHSPERQDTFRRLRSHIPEGTPSPFPASETYVPLATMAYNPHLSAPKQTFSVFKEVKDLDLAFGILVLQVLENWGGSRTRLCQVEVHGQPFDRNWYVLPISLDQYFAAEHYTRRRAQ